MSGRSWAWVLLAAALAGACAKPQKPRPPEGEAYPFPSSLPGEASGPEQKAIQRAWRSVLTGDTADAERRFAKLLRRHQGLVAVETGLAFARMRAGRLPEAAAGFEAVLENRPDYVPALIGAASAARRGGDPEAALRFLRRAEAVASGDAIVKRGLAEVKLQVTERRLAAARGSLAAGQPERAVEEYRSALEAAPEVSGLRMELANLLADRGDLAEAAAVLEADRGDDRQVLLRLGEVRGRMGEHALALEAYRRLLARDPRDDEALRGAQAVRQALELLRMPEEYQRIRGASQITRADLAALVSAKVTALSRIGGHTPKVAIDISGSWAREHVIRVLALGLMDLYPNHTFQPAAVVRRGELARAVQRVLDLLSWPPAPVPALSDMSRNNLLYYPASRVVAAGLMDLTPAGAFEPWRPVSGEDAVRVIEGLVRLVGP